MSTFDNFDWKNLSYKQKYPVREIRYASKDISTVLGRITYYSSDKKTLNINHPSKLPLSDLLENKQSEIFNINNINVYGGNLFEKPNNVKNDKIYYSRSIESIPYPKKVEGEKDLIYKKNTDLGASRYFDVYSRYSENNEIPFHNLEIKNINPGNNLYKEKTNIERIKRFKKRIEDMKIIKQKWNELKSVSKKKKNHDKIKNLNKQKNHLNFYEKESEEKNLNKKSKRFTNQHITKSKLHNKQSLQVNFFPGNYNNNKREDFKNKKKFEMEDKKSEKNKFQKISDVKEKEKEKVINYETVKTINEEKKKEETNIKKLIHENSLFFKKENFFQSHLKKEEASISRDFLGIKNSESIIVSPLLKDFKTRLSRSPQKILDISGENNNENTPLKLKNFHKNYSIQKWILNSDKIKKETSDIYNSILIDKTTSFFKQNELIYFPTNYDQKFIQNSINKKNENLVYNFNEESANFPRKTFKDQLKEYINQNRDKKNSFMDKDGEKKTYLNNIVFFEDFECFETENSLIKSLNHDSHVFNNKV